MPPVHGKNTDVFIDGYDLTAWFNNAQISQSVDMADVTAFGNNVKQFLPGDSDGTIQLQGMWDGAVAAVDEVLSARLGQDADVLFAVGFVTATPFALGNPVWFMNAKESRYDVNGSVTDAVRITAEGRGGGPFQGESRGYGG